MFYSVTTTHKGSSVLLASRQVSQKSQNRFGMQSPDKVELSQGVRSKSIFHSSPVSTFADVQWDKLSGDVTEPTVARVVTAVWNDIFDKKSVLKPKKNKAFQQAKVCLTLFNQHNATDTDQRNALLQAEKKFAEAALAYPFKYQKAEAYQYAAIMAKVTGDTQGQMQHYIQQARENFAESHAEILELQRQSEMNLVDHARMLVGAAPVVMEWLGRMLFLNHKLKPAETLSARLLLPLEKTEKDFLAEKLLDCKRMSQLPEICKQLMPSEQSVSTQSEISG